MFRYALAHTLAHLFLSRPGPSLDALEPGTTPLERLLLNVGYWQAVHTYLKGGSYIVWIHTCPSNLCGYVLAPPRSGVVKEPLLVTPIVTPHCNSHTGGRQVLKDVFRFGKKAPPRSRAVVEDVTRWLRRISPLLTVDKPG